METTSRARLARSLGIFPLSAIAGVFKLNRCVAGSTTLPRHPWAPVIYLTIGSCILLLCFSQRPVESSIAILPVLIGVPVYLSITAIRTMRRPVLL